MTVAPALVVGKLSLEMETTEAKVESCWAMLSTVECSGSMKPIRMFGAVFAIFVFPMGYVPISMELVYIYIYLLIDLIRTYIKINDSCRSNRLSPSIWVFPKMGGFSPQIIHLNEFSIIFTIHFGGKPPIVGNTHLYSMSWQIIRLQTKDHQVESPFRSMSIW